MSLFGGILIGFAISSIFFKEVEERDKQNKKRKLEDDCEKYTDEILKKITFLKGKKPPSKKIKKSLKKINTDKKEDKEEKKEKDCSICYESFNSDNLCEIPCKNKHSDYFLCTKCNDNLVSRDNLCPLCRYPLKFVIPTINYNESIIDYWERIVYSKNNNNFYILAKGKIIFRNFDTDSYVMRNFSASRIDIIKQFSTGPNFLRINNIYFNPYDSYIEITELVSIRR
jgi:hypothetical protein